MHLQNTKSVFSEILDAVYKGKSREVILEMFKRSMPRQNIEKMYEEAIEKLELYHNDMKMRYSYEDCDRV